METGGRLEMGGLGAKPPQEKTVLKYAQEGLGRRQRCPQASQYVVTQRCPKASQYVVAQKCRQASQ